MNRRLNLMSIIVIFGLVTVAGIATVLFTSLYAMNRIKINGQLYNTIKLGNDLIADILPPPEYVLEAYLEATLAMQDPSSINTHQERLVQLHKDYDDRFTYWSKSDLDDVTKKMLIDTSDADVQRFWTITEKHMLPALQRNDKDIAESAYRELTSAYQSHRSTIDQIVKRAGDNNTALEQVALEDVQKFSAMVWSTGTIIAVVVLSGLLAIILAIVRPIVAMTDVMRQLSGGRLDVTIPSRHRRDEIGLMARAVEVFKENAAAASEFEQRRIASDAAAAMEKQRALRAMAATVENELGDAVVEISAQTSEMVENAGHVTRAAKSVEMNSQSVAAAAEEALTNAQTVATASDQLCSSIAEISQQIHSTRSQTTEVVQSVEHARNAMATLSQSAAQVGDITALISDIAGRTNLLALNATIEAARAGESGRGFAVVASEVKSLASQTAKATGEIAEQIAAIQAAADSSVAAVDEISERIGRLESASTLIASAIEEQNATTREIARTVSETTLAAREVAERIAAVSGEAAETGERAITFRENSTNIGAKVDQLRDKLIHVVKITTTAA
ncbi:MAG: HAMP domain-containing protein [Xanthobacteraceae bacterium]|nr:HAMP domain-containing protein [Xanthobacteraceae bacterium]